jgi:exodeoxyribonuclease VII small subunit
MIVPDSADCRTFEELMTELELVTERLAAGDLGIEAAADLYEQALRLHALASERLARVQARVEALTATQEPGRDDRRPG